MTKARLIRGFQATLAVSWILELLITVSPDKVLAENLFDDSLAENLSITFDNNDLNNQKKIQPYTKSGTALILSQVTGPLPTAPPPPPNQGVNPPPTAPPSNQGVNPPPSAPPRLPNPLPPKQPELPIPIPRPLPRIPLNIKPPSTLPQSEQPLNLPEIVTVSKFEFEGNTAFSSENLSKVTAEFINRPLTKAELLQVEVVLTKLYNDAGYIYSRASILADQSFPNKEGIIKIRIIEGGISQINVRGTKRLNSSYVSSRIALATNKPLNRERLLQALQLLQMDPLIQNISAELSPGSRPQESLLDVRVTEAQSLRVELFIDNGRAPVVGTIRRGIRINEGNFLGFGDRVDLKYTNTDGSNTLDFNYIVPVNPQNGRVSFSGWVIDAEVTESPFDTQDITGNSLDLELTFRQPIIQTPSQELGLGLSLFRQENNTKKEGQPFPLSPGADSQGKTIISGLRFFQDYTQRSAQEILLLRSQFSLGIDLFNDSKNEDASNSGSFAWRGQGQYVRFLAPDTLLVLRSEVLLSTRSTVPLEPFGLGGLQTVRGYRQDELITSNGVFASAEVRLPILRVKEVKGTLQAIPFIDFGVAWNNSGNFHPDPNTLVGVGMGLQWQMGNQFTARLDYGIPLTDTNSNGNTWQDDGLYFSLNYSPF
ncbi:MAG: ShlB/FhaC/HecB family hemolysin secretion/activation protein [Nostocaceae cyanobacterium]|nr:ShlB/FhaC/HecB family hemolysin secretion/activation protein [Nostocaceae cyanobacterium]